MAGRTVGNIEVTVTADTGKLKAQLIKEGKVAGGAFKQAIESQTKDIQAKIDEIETSEAAKRAEAIIFNLRKRIEAQLKGIDLGIDTRDAMADLRTFEAHAEATKLALKVTLSERDLAEINAQIRALTSKERDVKIQFEADLAAINVNLEKFRAQQHADEVSLRIGADLSEVNRNIATLRARSLDRMDINFGADMTRVNTAIAAMRERLRVNRVELRLDSNLATLNAGIEQMRARQGSRSVDINFGAQLAGINANIARFRAIQEANPINIPIKGDTSALEKAMGASGGRAGSAFGDGAERGLSTRMKAIIGGIILLAEPAAVALQGLLASTTSVLSSAFSALGGLGGAIAPALAAAGASVATLIVGFQGMGTALGSVTEEFSAAVAEGRAFNMQAEGISQAMASLGPQARGVVTAFAELLPVFSQLRGAVQENLFAGLGSQMSQLSGSVLPQISAGLQGLASEFNQFFSQLAGRVADIDFTSIFAALRPVVESVLDAFLELADAVEPFLLAAAPAAIMLGQSFEKTAASLTDMIKAGEKSGELTNFLTEGVQSSRQWAGLLKDLGDALFTVFQAGKSSGDGFLASLRDIVQRFDSWAESIEGQKALEEFFETGKQLMSDMVPILKGLQGFFDNLVSEGAIGRFGDLTAAVGKVLPFLGQLLELVGRTQILTTFMDAIGLIADAIQPVLPVLQEMADTIGVALQAALMSIAPHLPALAEAIGNLAEALSPAIASTIALIADAFGAFIQVITPLINLIAKLPTPLLTAATALLVFHGSIGKLGKVMGGIQGAFTTFNKGMATAGSTATGTLTGMIGKANIWAAGIGAAVAIGVVAWDAYTAKQQEVEQRTAEVAAALNDSVDALLDVSTTVDGATLGMTALSNALADTGVDGEKLTTSMGELGRTTADSADFLIRLKDAGENATGVLDELLDKTKLNSGEQEFLASVVNSTDDSFSDWAQRMSLSTDAVRNMNPELRAQAEALGIVEGGLLTFTPEMIAAGDAIEEVQDQAQKIDLQPMIRQFLSRKAAQSEANQEALAAAEADEGMLRSGNDLMDLYINFTARLDANADATANKATAAEEAAEADERQAIQAAAAEEAIAKEAEAAARAAEKFADLESALGGVDLTGVIAPADEAAASLQAMAREADTAAAAADSLSEAFDKLFSPALDFQEATDAVAESSAKVQEALEGGAEAADLRKKAIEEDAKGNTDAAATYRKQAEDLAAVNATLEGNSEAALTNRQIIRDHVKAIQDQVVASVNSNKAIGDTSAKFQQMYDDLVLQVSAWTGSADSAKAYLAEIGLVPEHIQTLITTPGLLDSLVKIAEFDDDLDGIPNSKDMEFNMPGIDAIRTKAQELGIDIAAIPDDVLIAFFTSGYAQTVQEHDTVDAAVTGLDGESATVTITADTEEAETGMSLVNVAMEGLREGENSKAEPEITVPSATDAEVAILGVLGAGIAVDQMNAEATIGVDDQTQAAMDAAFTAGIAWDAGTYKADLGVEDTTQAAMDAAFTAGIAWDTGTYSATVGTDGTASSDMDGVIGKAATWDGITANATVGVDDQASGAIDGITGKLDTLFGFGGKSTGTVQVTAEGAAEAKEQVDAVKTAVQQLDGTAAAPKITLPTQQTVKTQLDGLKTQLTNLDNQVATPSISLPTWFTVISQVGALSSAIRNIPDGSANITVSGVQFGIDKVNELDRAIDRLESKTITVTTRNVTVGGSMTGAIVPGSQGGELIHGPTLRAVGERGYDEAIIPLQLPLNRVDPSVRELAALLRGESPTPKMGPTKIINQYMTVNAVATDPVAVATQVVNRSAMLAH